MKFLAVSFFVLAVSLNAQAATKYEFVCQYKDAVEGSEPFYGNTAHIVIEGASATVIGPDFGTENDTGYLSDNEARFDRPRFFGFVNIADCASGNYLEVDRQMLKGKAGDAEFNGPGNEDCGVAQDLYSCTPVKH